MGTIHVSGVTGSHHMDPQQNFTVLVVDDERDVTDLYRIWLEEHHRVRTAYDGEEALDLLDGSIDVVLLDRRMPGLSGDEVLERIEERDLDCRVVMVTAVKPDFDVIEMGFDDYLVKPVSRSDLYDAVDRMATRSTYDDQLREYFSLASKKAVLQSEKNAEALRADGRFRALEADLSEIRSRVDETRSGFGGHDDFVAAFRDI